MVQPDLFPNVQITDDDLAALRSHLYSFGWQTRRQVCQALGWTERHVRDVAEAMGADVVRGQAGFKLTSEINRDSPDIAIALQARDAAISQGKKMIKYGINLGRRIHARIG